MAKRMKKKKSHGAAAYGVFITFYVLILAVGIFYGLTRLWSYAETVDSTGPEDAIEEYIQELSKTIWNENLVQTVSTMPHEFQTNEECVAVVRDMLEGELSYRRQPGSKVEDGIVHYDILCGKNLIGKVSLVRDESKRGQVPEHQLPWIVQSDEFYVDGLYTSMRVTVPENFTVRLNGIVLGPEYIVERGIEFDVLKDYYAKYPDLPKKVTYEAHNVFGVLEPTIYDEDGNLFVFDETKNDYQYIKHPPQETMSRLESFAIGFADQYKHFSAGVGDFWTAYERVRPYIISGSDLDNRLQMAMDGYDWAHTVSYEFNGAVLNSAIDVGGGFYILDITTETTVLYPNKGDNGVVHEFGGLTVIAQDFGDSIRAVTVENY